MLVNLSLSLSLFRSFTNLGFAVLWIKVVLKKKKIFAYEYS